MSHVKKQVSNTASRNVRWYNYLKTASYAILLLGIYPRGKKVYTHSVKRVCIITLTKTIRKVLYKTCNSGVSNSRERLCPTPNTAKIARDLKPMNNESAQRMGKPSKRRDIKGKVILAKLIKIL